MGNSALWVLCRTAWNTQRRLQPHFSRFCLWAPVTIWHHVSRFEPHIITPFPSPIRLQTLLNPYAYLFSEETNTTSSRIACVLVLLFRVSHGECSSIGTLRDEPTSSHTLELVTGQGCLNALLDYVERCKRPLGRAARILARVLRLVNYYYK